MSVSTTNLILALQTQRLWMWPGELRDLVDQAIERLTILAQRELWES